MKDKTKKLLRNTGLFAAAVGVTAAKTVKWSAKKVWDHKEEIAGGIAGGVKGVYHIGQDVYGATIKGSGFEKRLIKLREQSEEYAGLCAKLGEKLSRKEMLLDSLGISTSVIHSYYHIDYIPEEVEKAYIAAYPIKSQTDSLKDIIEDADADELSGLISGVKGKLFEMRYADFLNDGHLPDGYEAVLAESAVNPGWDIAIVDDDGFVVWQIQKEGLKNSILVVANYNSPTEKFNIEENGNCYTEIKEGCEVFDKTIELSCDYSIVSEFRFDGLNYIEEKFVTATNSLSFGKITPAEFKFFMVIK